MTAGVLLAHAGGWDETLFVLVPIAIFGSLLAVANKRAAQATESKERPLPSDAPPSTSHEPHEDGLDGEGTRSKPPRES